MLKSAKGHGVSFKQFVISLSYVPALRQLLLQFAYVTYSAFDCMRVGKITSYTLIRGNPAATNIGRLGGCHLKNSVNEYYL